VPSDEGTHPDVFLQQVDLDDEQRRVEDDEAAEAEHHLSQRNRRHRQVRREHLADRPRLAAVFGDDPPELHRDPRQGNAPHRNLHDPAVARELAPGEDDERGAEHEEQPEPDADHEAERPEDRRHVRDRVVDGRGDLLRRRDRRRSSCTS
jgi:hypothetical protein